LGRTITLATGVFWTVIAAMADFPPTFAATCVLPSASPVTTPAADTLAMSWSLTVHTTETPLSGLPSGPVAVTCSGTCEPTATLVDEGLTTTDDTSP
jgi:hypothetical protein